MAGSKKRKAAYPSPVPRSIKASEFKAKCLDLMNEVRERHVEYIVTKRGSAVARLGPVTGPAPSPFGFMRGTLMEEHDIVSPDAKTWTERDSDPLSQD